MGCKMIKVENLYTRAHKFLDESLWKDEYKLNDALLPGLKLQAHAFNTGALTQLLACVADLRIWAVQFRALGKDEIAKELDQFATDWAEEGRDLIK